VKITIKLYAVLQIGRFKEKVFDFPAGMAVRDVIEGLKLPPEHVDILLVNGVHVDAGRLLEENDVLSLLPMVEGG
jgi:sulfur carrier protein ThiS